MFTGLGLSGCGGIRISPIQAEALIYILQMYAPIFALIFKKKNRFTDPRYAQIGLVVSLGSIPILFFGLPSVIGASSAKEIYLIYPAMVAVLFYFLKDFNLTVFASYLLFELHELFAHIIGQFGVVFNGFDFSLPFVHIFTLAYTFGVFYCAVKTWRIRFDRFSLSAFFSAFTLSSLTYLFYVNIDFTWDFSLPIYGLIVFKRLVWLIALIYIFNRSSIKEKD